MVNCSEVPGLGGWVGREIFRVQGRLPGGGGGLTGSLRLSRSSYPLACGDGVWQLFYRCPRNHIVKGLSPVVGQEAPALLL